MSAEIPESDAYSEQSLRAKLARHARVAGETVVERTLQFHYALQKPDLPPWAQAIWEELRMSPQRRPETIKMAQSSSFSLSVLPSQAEA